MILNCIIIQFIIELFVAFRCCCQLPDEAPATQWMEAIRETIKFPITVDEEVPLGQMLPFLTGFHIIYSWHATWLLASHVDTKISIQSRKSSFILKRLRIFSCYVKRLRIFFAPVVWGIRIQPTFALVRVVKGD